MSRRASHLAAGLVLFTYVFFHLLNHAFGVVSLEALNAVRQVLISPWTTTAGILLLASCALFHLSSALWVMFRRRTMRMPAWQWTQLVLGLSIPLLVAEHAVGTGYARLVHGLQPNYEYVLATMWHFDPWKGWLQMSLLIAAWGHGCVGLHNWLKVKPGYLAWQSHLYALALLLPLASLLGFISAGLDVRALAQDPSWTLAMIQAINYPDAEAVRSLFEVRDTWMVSYVAAVASVFFIRWARDGLINRATTPVYVNHVPSSRQVKVLPGATVLESFKAAGIAHASVCGGRARCSTCRVLISEDDADACAPPEAAEQKVLHRMNLPPNVRLACQMRPRKSISCEPLLPPDVSMGEVMQSGSFTAGHEVNLTVMFTDLRGFTALSESKLPFDVVYLLNQYFESMGHAVEDGGGVIDKFIGDGIMATFDGKGDPKVGARDALKSAAKMCAELDRINERLKNDLVAPLRLGIGLHAGPVIRGTMGYGNAKQVTVIGDTVNAASRLESATKEQRVQLLFSQSVYDYAGLDVPTIETLVITVRGREEALTVYRMETACSDTLALS